MDIEDDPFQYCIYCGADCYADSPDHAPECPFVTGLFPITEDDCGPPCENCGHRNQPQMSCYRCDQQFKVGDYYMQIEMSSEQKDSLPILGDDEEDVEYYEIVCIGCAMANNIKDMNQG